MQFKKIFIYVPVCLCMSLCVCAQRSQKRVLDPLELHLWVVVSHTIWVLGTELRSSTVSSLAISLVYKKYNHLLFTCCH